MKSILTWLGQTSTIAGMTAMGGAVTSILSGALTWQTALPVAIGGLISALLPENPTVAQAGQTVTADLIGLTGQLMPAAAPVVAAPAAPAPAAASTPTAMAAFAAQLAPHLAAAMATPAHGQGAP